MCFRFNYTMFSKLATILHNPEILLVKFKIRSRQQIYITKNRNLMIQICNEIDFLLSEDMPINEIVESISTKFGFIKYPIIWYILIRKYHLQTIVETGVSMGWSSFMILTALQRENSSGKLHSIDINSSTTVQRDGGTGYLIPDCLKEYWDLRIGDVRELLEPMLLELNQIDMFIHDSDHSYAVMSFEYNLVWDFLKDSGFLCSDDINHSNAFDEFIAQHKGSLTHLCKFQEISRPSDDVHKRPMIGFFQKTIS